MKFNRITILIALAAVFAVAVTVTFGARRALGRKLDAQPSADDLRNVREQTAAAIPRLPADTETKLNAALYPEASAPANIADPFVDRAGLNAKAASSAPFLTPRVTTPVSLAPSVPDRLARLSQWQQSVRAAVAGDNPLPSMSSAYLINELSPTGRLELGNERGVWFYLESERRTISAGIGTKFYDGTLVGVNDEGAQFKTGSGQVKLVPWARKDTFGQVPTTPTTDVANPRAQPVGNYGKPIGRNTRPARDYSDLQEAVRERYAPQPISSNTKSTPITTEEASVNTVVKSATVDNETSAANDTSGARRVNYNHVAAPKASPEASPTPVASAPSTEQALKPPAQSSKENNAPSKTVAASAPSPSVTTSTLPLPKVSRPAPPDRNPICDNTYKGELISLTNDSDRPISLLSLVNEFNKRYNANIVLDYDIQETPVRLTVNQIPWTSVLHTVLDLNDLDTVCLDGKLLQIAKRIKIVQINDQRRKSAPIVREVFRLRYLQPTSGGRTNLAGQTQSSGADIQTLEGSIREILKTGGDQRGEARRVPGRNEILVAATQEQMNEIRDLIARMDRPGYQVKISALVYTANENRLRDIGSQLSVAGFNLSTPNIGGISTLPNATTNQSGGSGSSSNGQGVAGSNPGGIPGLLGGMRQPINGLSATNPLVTLGGGMVFPGGQFALQITAAQQQGAINIQSRPMGIVADGETLDLTRGIQIPVVTTTIAGGAPFQSGQVQFIEASRLTQITPQVAEDEHGRPSFVTLNLRLEDNSVDTSLGTFNGVPGVNRQSLQTVLRLRNGETAVIGGLSADQVSNSKSKVPGLGDIPIVGNMFKRKQTQENRDRLYFAISVEVIPQDSPIPSFAAPADATTTQPMPPAPQKPGPYKTKNE
jgi:type II secretory pathway component GspD/PulD (secretin)